MPFLWQLLQPLIRHGYLHHHPGGFHNHLQNQFENLLQLLWIIFLKHVDTLYKKNKHHVLLSFRMIHLRNNLQGQKCLLENLGLDHALLAEESLQIPQNLAHMYSYDL